jgi:dTDP-glucose 4,6-dehydratase
MAEWAAMIIQIGEEAGHWPAGREIVSTAERYRPGASEVMALRVGYEKLHDETGWQPKITWEEGIRRTIAWYAANPERWHGRVDWAKRAPTTTRR